MLYIFIKLGISWRSKQSMGTVMCLQSTYCIRKALPDVKIWALDPEDEPHIL